jgi:hypothetical protein
VELPLDFYREHICIEVDRLARSRKGGSKVGKRKRLEASRDADFKPDSSESAVVSTAGGNRPKRSKKV